MTFRLVVGLGLAFWLTASSFTASGQTLSIAHRGNSLYAPENTLAACFAAQGKADLVEIDARVSSDGKLVLMHDASVDRTTDGTGTVASKTLAQLKALDAGSWFAPTFAGERIPLLEEMITNTLPFATPLIEHKAGSAAVYVNELQRLGVGTNVVLQSFDWSFLTSVHALAPELQLCALGSGAFSQATLTTITNTGARTVAWEKSSVTPEMVSLVQAHGLKVFVWTVDSSVEIQSFINLGVDGIISNDPATVKGVQQPPATNAPGWLGDGLIAYWKMDDGLAAAFATVVADSQGTNRATLVRNDGASHWFEGSAAKLGGSLKVEGTNAFVAFPQTPDLDINTNKLTLSAWLWLPILPAQQAASFGAIFDSTTDCYVLYLDKANNELRFKITTANGNAARPGIPANLLPTNQWIHVVGTYDGQAYPASGRTVIYLNGVAVDAHLGTDGGAGTGLTGNVKTGQIAAMGREGPSGGNYFTGFVDDVALWKRALAAAEIERLFTAGQNGQSLGELLKLPTTLIQFTSVGKTSGGAVTIQFKNTGSWQSFRLLRAVQWDGPFAPVNGATATALGNGDFRFNYASTTNTAEFFRVEAW